MLVRTSSGNTSVGHLTHTPNGFSKLHRPDISFQCGGLIFPVHSLLLSVSSRFFTDFFTFMAGQARPDVISLDAVKCSALSGVSLSYYLDAVYSGALPQFDEVSEEVEVLRLAHFFGNAPLTVQLCDSLGRQLGRLGEAEVLQVFRAASDLKLRRLVTDCLALLLPQFGNTPNEETVSAAIEHMDPTLSKVVLTQLAVSGAAPLAVLPPGGPAAIAASASDEGSGASGSSAACEQPRAATPDCSAACTPVKRTSSDGSSAFAQELDRMKEAFVGVLEAKGWGQ
ncbi:hypothetical protein ABPG75_002553 [Micractinium tetrahymenae]